MVKSFGDRETELIWSGTTSLKLPTHIQRRARRKLRMLHAAADLNDLRIPPANRLEALKGDLNSYHSIRINDQWRIIFIWENSHAYQVRIVDYH